MPLVNVSFLEKHVQCDFWIGVLNGCVQNADFGVILPNCSHERSLSKIFYDPLEQNADSGGFAYMTLTIYWFTWAIWYNSSWIRVHSLFLVECRYPKNLSEMRSRILISNPYGKSILAEHLHVALLTLLWISSLLGPYGLLWRSMTGQRQTEQVHPG